MSSIELRGPAAGRGVSRQMGRALAQLDGQTHFALARIDAEADVQASKVDAMTAITQRGLQGAAFISQVEQQLAQAVPLAASRLQAIGDIGTLGLSQIVMDTAIGLRRV